MTSLPDAVSVGNSLNSTHMVTLGTRVCLQRAVAGRGSLHTRFMPGIVFRRGKGSVKPVAAALASPSGVVVIISIIIIIEKRLSLQLDFPPVRAKTPHEWRSPHNFCLPPPLGQAGVLLGFQSISHRPSRPPPHARAQFHAQLSFLGAAEASRLLLQPSGRS